jgi:hypothetical protein
MTADRFSALRKELVKGRLLVPGDDGYEASLQRWSLTCVKPAVGWNILNLTSQKGLTSDLGSSSSARNR